jgi:glycosyltransferase involved in cell wall biosynthesis
MNGKPYSDDLRERVVAAIESGDTRESYRAVQHGADIVVYPTIGEEPYGLVPVEAMSCPIIASKSGGIPETVVDRVTGYIVSKGDAAALADR